MIESRLKQKRKTQSKETISNINVRPKMSTLDTETKRRNSITSHNSAIKFQQFQLSVKYYNVIKCKQLTTSIEIFLFKEVFNTKVLEVHSIPGVWSD